MDMCVWLLGYPWTAAHLVEHALGAPDLALPLLDDGGCVSDGDGKGLEGTLGPVVVVVAAYAVHVQCSAASLGKALQAVGNHLAAQVAQLLPLQPQVGDTVGAVAEVDDGARQSLVEGRVGVAEACKAGGALQSVLEGGAEGKEGVLGGVVVVDVQVALDADAQRPAGVLGHGVDHVVEEADARVDGDLLRVGLLCGVVLVDLLALAVQVLLVQRCPEVGMGVGLQLAAIEVDRDLDLGLIGVAVEGGGAWHCGGESAFRFVSERVLQFKSGVGLDVNGGCGAGRKSRGGIEGTFYESTPRQTLPGPRPTSQASGDRRAEKK
jgi:hypothetical protein